MLFQINFLFHTFLRRSSQPRLFYDIRKFHLRLDQVSFSSEHIFYHVQGLFIIRLHFMIVIVRCYILERTGFSAPDVFHKLHDFSSGIDVKFRLHVPVYPMINHNIDDPATQIYDGTQLISRSSSVWFTLNTRPADFGAFRIYPLFVEMISCPAARIRAISCTITWRLTSYSCASVLPDTGMALFFIWLTIAFLRSEPVIMGCFHLPFCPSIFILREDSSAIYPGLVRNVSALRWKHSLHQAR